jgi:hypothetical protein
MSNNRNHGNFSPIDDDAVIDSILTGMMELEGEYAFRCADCSEIFETVIEWGEHALEKYSDGFPGIDPVRKQ